MISEVAAAMIKPIMLRAEKACAAAPGDYIQNGLLHCVVCNTPKETKINVLGTETIVPCMCNCAATRYEREKMGSAERERLARINQLRANGIKDKSLLEVTFAKDDNHDPKMTKLAKKYVSEWGTERKENRGLLLWGNTGTGKTFYAACIANALIDSGVPVLVTSLTKIVNAVSSLRGEERIAYIDDLMQFDLLVLDDLGAERQSSFASEVVYMLVDERIKSGKPMIITTNTPLQELKNTANMDNKRIYDRILAKCAPISFMGESLRERERTETVTAIRELLQE